MKKTPSQVTNGTPPAKQQQRTASSANLKKITPADVNGKKATSSSPPPKADKKETMKEKIFSKIFKSKPEQKEGASDSVGDNKNDISSSSSPQIESKETTKGLSKSTQKPRSKSKSPPLSKPLRATPTTPRARSLTVSASPGTPLNSSGKISTSSTKRDSLRDGKEPSPKVSSTTSPPKKTSTEGNGTIGRSATRSPTSKTPAAKATTTTTNTSTPSTKSSSSKEKEKKFATVNGPMKIESEKKSSHDLIDGKTSLSRSNSVVKRKEVKKTPKLEDIFKVDAPLTVDGTSSSAPESNEDPKDKQRVASPNILIEPSKGEIMKEKPKANPPKKQSCPIVTLSSLPAEVKAKIIKILGLKEKRNLRASNKSFKQIMDQYLGLVVKVSEVDLNEASLITKVKYLTMDHPTLFGIDLTDWTICSLISKEILIHLPRELLYLNLAGCRNIETLENLPPGLTHLNVSNCFKLTDEEMKHLPPTIQHLNLSGCFKITDNVVTYLPATVVHLDLRGCYKLSDKFVTKLPPNIRTLYLGSCYKITDAALKSLPPTLKFIDLSKCSKVTAEAVQILSQSIVVKKED